MEPEPSAISADDVGDREASQTVDVATILGVTLVVYTCSSVLHEAVGHGLTCVLLGGKVACIASTVCIPGGEPISEGAARVVAAGGTLVNLIAAGICWAVLGAGNVRSPIWRYFLWLSLAVNGFIGAGYLAVPTLIGFGDWVNVLNSLNPYWVLRAGVVLIGLILYVAIYWLAAREMQWFLGQDLAQRRRRALKLSLIPYLAGGLAFCVAGSFNPVGMKLVLISAAAASFGGTAGLAWLTPCVMGMCANDQPREHTVEIKRDWRWIAGGIVTGLALIFVLGPGVRFK